MCVPCCATCIRSLFVLGKVIRGINTKAPRIAFRDSKLTRLLREALRSSHAAVMVCTVSENPRDVAQTRHTLTYAAKAAAMKVSGEGCAPVPPAPTPAAHAGVPPTPSRAEQLAEWQRRHGRTPNPKRKHSGVAVCNTPSRGRLTTPRFRRSALSTGKKPRRVVVGGTHGVPWLQRLVWYTTHDACA